MSAPRRRLLPVLNRSRVLAGLPWLVVTLLLTVPLGAPAPVPGLDPSWRLVLNTVGDAHFGRDIVFTYGPWGYLDWPLVVDRSAYALALLARAGVLAALWTVATLALARALPLWAAAPAASVFVVLAAPSELSTLAVAVAVTYVLHVTLRRRDPGERRTPLVAVGILAALAGLVLQVKLSNGLAIGTLAFLALANNLGTIARRRLLTDLLTACAAFLGVGGIAWVLRGQSLADVVPWLRGSLQLATGYSEAMSLEALGAADYVVAVVLGAAAVVATLPGLRVLGAARSVVVLLVIATTGIFAFKAGFTRHDLPHQPVFFVVVAALLLGIVGTGRIGSWLAILAAVVATAMGSWLAIFATVFATSSITAVPGPATVTQRWREDVNVLVSSERQQEAVDAARAAMVAAYVLPPAILEEMRGKPVLVEPRETSVTWAYELDRFTVPVFQLYAAYTPALDDLNAAALAGAPDDLRVLHHEGGAVDQRNPLWDSPTYRLEILCHYRTVVAPDAGWSLLAKSAPRCGPDESLGDQVVAAGERVTVPPGEGDVLVARFTPDAASLPVRLQRAVSKVRTPLYVTAGGSTYQLSRTMAPSGVLVTVPELEAAANAPVDIRTLTFSEPGTLELVRIPIRS